jgi:general secretion pathway protein K
MGLRMKRNREGGSAGSTEAGEAVSVHAVAPVPASLASLPSLRLVRGRRRSRREGGYALILVLAAIGLMTFTVIPLVNYLNDSVDDNGLESLRFRALHLAECGIAVGLHPQIRPGDPALQQVVGEDSGFSVTISSEGARIPINYITDSRYREIIYNLFILWQLSPQEAETAVDGLADWVDTDSQMRTYGGEADYYKERGYSDFPRNKGFGSLDEMILAKGMDAVERMKPEWRNYFSIYGDGYIDLNYAPQQILMAVADVEENAAQSLIRERSGADGIPNTEDDKKLSLNQATQFLGMDGAQAQSLNSLLTADHLTRRVESVGRIGEATYKVAVIARRQDDGSLNYLARFEE